MNDIAKILTTVIVLASLIACQKVETFPTKDTVTVATQPKGMESAEAGSKLITIWPTADWTAISNVDWITVEPSSGVRGTQEVKLVFTANTTSEERVGIVTFKAAEGSDTYTLTQNK